MGGMFDPWQIGCHCPPWYVRQLVYPLRNTCQCMRTIEEIEADIKRAVDISDAATILVLADEMDEHQTKEAEAAAVRARGWALYLRGDYAESLQQYDRALRLNEVLGSHRGVARVLSNIGIVYMAIGNNGTALEHFQRALTLNHENGNRRGVAAVTANIGITYSAIGDYTAALEYQHRALAMHQELGDQASVARDTGNIGAIHFHTGDYPTALDYKQRSLELYLEIGDRRNAAYIIANIGNVYAAANDYTSALLYHQRSLALHQELGNRSGVASATANIGGVQQNIGDLTLSLASFQQALDMYKELGEHGGVANMTGNLIVVHQALGDYVTASALLTTMDAMQIDDPANRIQREQCRAVLQQQDGDLDGAALTLQRALQEAQEHGLRSCMADVHKDLRDLAQKRNDFAAYIEHNNEFLRITEEINGKETAAKLALQAKQREIDAERKEYEKHLAVLHNTLPKHVVDRVARGEEVTDHYDHASVIFLDIVGFTRISDHLPSDRVVRLLSQVFTTLDTVCEKHHVVKIKTIGDSFMAVSFSEDGGRRSETHVSNAAMCALEMMEVIEALNTTTEPGSWAVGPGSSDLGLGSWALGPLQVRIGIHCGPVTAGVIGTQRLQYDVWGDTVNIASRMESHGEPGRIQVSGAFAQALRGAEGSRGEQKYSDNNGLWSPVSGLIYRGETEIKGKGTMQTYWLEARDTKES